MGNIATAERTATYKLGTFVQWGGDNGEDNKLVFVSAWEFNPNMDDWDIDRIDSAAPIYTKKTDVLGTFSFNTKNAYSLYDTGDTPPTNSSLVSKMIAAIASGEPSTIIFAPIMRAAEVDTFEVKLKFSGRVTNTPINQVLDQGVQDVEISGEIVDIAYVKKAAPSTSSSSSSSGG